MKEIFRKNNFDLIRLFAALQVVIHHLISHLEIKETPELLLSILSYFPGVPIFFFISGFLISKSYENNSVITEYIKNRILRIYPALIVCLFLTLFSIYIVGYFDNKSFSGLEFIAWVFGQMTFVQFYNPDFMRDFGTGVMNGSLWTISVELQFYIIMPILYGLFSLVNGKNSNRNLFFLIIIFLLFHIIKFLYQHEYADHLLYKLFSLSFLPWIWMFLVGIIFQKNFIFFYHLLSGKIFYILLLYLLIAYSFTNYLGFNVWDEKIGMNPFLFLFLVAVIFSFAYSFIGLSNMLLRKNDISYGVYIYHIPIINLLIYYGYFGGVSVFIAFITTLLFALMSWFFVERNSMKLKKYSLNSISIAK